MVGKTPQVREIVFNVLDDNGERTVVAKGATSVDVGDTRELFTRTSNLEAFTTNNFSNISVAQSDILDLEYTLGGLGVDTSYSPLLLTLQTNHSDNVTRIDTLFTDLSANAVNVDGTFSNVIVLQDDISANVTRINTLFTDLQANAVNVDGTFSNVSILQVKQTADFANISSLQTDIEAVTEFGDITGLQANVVDLRNRVTTSSVRIGAGAGASAQNSAVSIGQQSGNFAGNNSIGLGGLANYNNTSEERGQREDCIVINATGATLNAPRSGTLVIGPIEEDNSNIICMMGANVLSSTTGACELTRTSLLKLMDSNVHISTNVSIANDTILFRPNGNGSFGGDIDINATLEVGGTSSFAGAMTLDDNLETTGTSSFGGKMEVNNDIDCNGESFIMKNNSANKIILRDDGTADFVSDVDVGGKLDVVNTSSFGGAMTLNNNIEITGTSSFGDDMSINSNVIQTGESFIMNNGTNDKISLTHNGNSSFSGTMTAGAINSTSGTVDIYHASAKLRVGTSTGAFNALINQDGTSSFGGAMQIDDTLTVNQRATLNNGLSVSAAAISSFAGVVRFDDTSSFGGVMTLNNDVEQKGGTFSMFDDDTTTKNVEFTRSGNGSFLGTLEASAINCTGSSGHVDIYHASAKLRVGTSTSAFNATINQDGNGSFGGAMQIDNELTIDGHTYWKHNGSDRCELTVGANAHDSEMLIRGDLKINNGSDTNASISTSGTGKFVTVISDTFILPSLDSTGFTFNGKIVGTGDIEAADFVITSDERLKSDISKIPKALDKVKELSGYTYTINEKESAGVIAQELLKVLPESVTTRDDGYYAVSYHGLIGLLIEAVKELSEKVK